MGKQKNIPELRFPGFNSKWERKSIGDISHKIGSGSTPLGGTKAYQQKGIMFIRSQNVNSDMLNLDDIVYISDEMNEKMSGSKVFGEDVLLNITGASIGRSCVVPKGFQIGNVNQHVCIIRLNQDFSPYFFQPFISSFRGQKLVFQEQAGGGREGLNFQSIRRFKILFPSLPEQQKIASFFTAIDKKISQLRRKKTLLEEYKKGVMQLIFSQKIRFKDDSGQEFPEWEKKKLGDILIESSEKTTISNQHRILSSTAKGIFNQDEYFNRDIASKDNSGYKILKKNQLVFSPQNLWLGNININTEFEIGIVSPSYKIFSFNSEFTTAQYCKYYLTIPEMMFEYEEASEQGASVVRRNLNMDIFLEIRIDLPTLPEQIKLANLLFSIDNKINHTKTQIEKAELWKKGLLQKMFV